MKKLFYIFFIIFVLMQLVQTKQENSIVKKELEITVPPEIKKILITSCYDCHSDEVSWPWYSKIAPFSWIISEHVNSGKKALNFSIWESYTQEEKEKKMKNIYRTVYSVMPLESYLWLHEDAKMSKEQRKKIRDWTGVRKKRR